MQINTAWLAVVREGVSVLGASVAVKKALIVGGRRQEGEWMFLVERVCDCFGHLEAFVVEKIVAGCARIDDTRGFEPASCTRRWVEILVMVVIIVD